MGYEDASATKMMATHCLMCGRPLVDPESLERGVGPICARKWKVFTAAGPVDATALAHAVETAPPELQKAVAEHGFDTREQVLSALAGERDPAAQKAAVSAIIHRTAHVWQRGPKEQVPYYLGSAMELTRALGYPGTADGLRAVFIEGRKFDEQGKPIGRKARPNGIVVTEKNGRWHLALPYLSDYSVWRSTATAIVNAGANASGRPDYTYEFGEGLWPSVLNALVDTLAGTLGELPSGETFVVPRERQPVPASAGEAAGAPDRVEPPLRPAPPEVSEGDIVQLHDGREMVVARTGVSSKGRWVGLMTIADADKSMERHGYLWFSRYKAGFVGIDEVQSQVATLAERKRLEEDVVEKPVVKRAADRPIPEALMPWQREGVLWLSEQGSGILAFEQGVGKTPTALAAMDAPAVVVVPASLRENWVRECTKWRPDLVVSRLDSASKLDESSLQADVLVTGYDTLKPNVVKALVARGTATLVIDEAQAIKELRVYAGPGGRPKPGKKPARAKAIYDVAQKSDRRILLTGTPMINGRPYELWPLLHLVDPKEWDSQTDYWDQYCDPQEVFIPGGKTVLNVNGSDNLGELRERVLDRFMLRRTKELLDLPPKVREYRAISLSEGVAKEYRAAAADFIEWVRQMGGAARAMRAARAKVIAQLTALKRLAGIGKVETVLAEARQFLQDTGRPLIIMGHHNEALSALESALSGDGYRVGTITGKVTGPKRQKAVDGFQLGTPPGAKPERRQYLDVLICSITAAGVGLTLTRAQDMIIFERVWRPFDLVQAEDRIHRFGQKNKCTIVYYDAAGTIDDKLAALLAEKAATAAQVIDGEDLDEDEAQDRVIRDMFGEIAQGVSGGMTPNPTPHDYDWADPVD